MKVIITDPLSEEGVAVLAKHAQVDQKIGLSQEQLVEIIGDYDALVVRSGTRVTAPIIKAGKKLKVIGRAGVGVDNIDVEQATRQGIIVINAPQGNTISAAEHAIAMLTSLARNIPEANAYLKSGKWERSRFMGVELYHKTLGIIGLGRIGSEVAKRARAMGMKIIAYDPYVPREQAEKKGVVLTGLEELLSKADFITLHLPLTEASYHIIGPRAFELMKPGVYLVNCARGGLIDEEALYKALVDKKVAGAALDVFEKEPPLDSPLLKLPNVLVTPHLGASTREAQVNVAIQVAEQVVHALRGEPVLTAVNMPAILPEVMGSLKPFLPLMYLLGNFYMQVFDGQLEEIELFYGGALAELPVAPLTTSCLIGILNHVLGEQVNFVNAPHIARGRGIKVRETTSAHVENFTNLVVMTAKAGGKSYTLSGTIFNNTDIRIVNIGDYRIEVIPSPYMLYCTYIDRPGVIGRVGTFLGNAGINIAGMQVGRKAVGGEAVMVLQVDEPVPPELVRELEKKDGILSTRFIQLKSSQLLA
ncbi:MAG: phosphoglycerate dehydrogenase [Dethiobacteria bacterium]|nr:phosphoglycerate dehydrogenase [Bacillota bacterium]HOP69479.1 phosphoglycerate dehydrogenase [Bacillota bacterium]HQD06237.1 phosphoglycerate dehydrogenase [Bacillota bacterium]